MAILGLAAAAARKLVPKAAAAVGRAVGKTAAAAARRPATAAAVATAGGAILQRTAGGPPPLPRGFAPGQGAIPRPREGVVGRTISRILPGGRTGREFMPLDEAGTDKYGRPIAVFPEMVEREIAPSGYVLVDAEKMNLKGAPPGAKIAVLKGAARAMGLWSARPKPPVSGWDMRAITRAASAKNRVKKLAGKVGLKATAKGR